MITELQDSINIKLYSSIDEDLSNYIRRVFTRTENEY